MNALKSRKDRKNEKTWKERITNRKYIACGICCLDRLDTNGGCATDWTKWNESRICHMEWMVSQMDWCTYDNLYDDRLVGTCSGLCLYAIWWNWISSVSAEKKSFESGF